MRGASGLAANGSASSVCNVRPAGATALRPPLVNTSFFFCRQLLGTQMLSALLFAAFFVSTAAVDFCQGRTSCGDCVALRGCSFCPAVGCLPTAEKCASVRLATSYNCARNSSVPYDDAYTRYTVYPLVGATKGKTSSEILNCASKSSPDVKHIARINVTCNSKSEFCTADLYSLPAKGLSAVVVHGSTGVVQFLHQAAQMFVRAEMKNVTRIGGAVIEYYATAFDALYLDGGLEKAVAQLIHDYPTHRLLLTGHSLGGALATLVAGTLASEGAVPSERIQLITFGVPRIGDASFGEAVERLLPYRFRVVNQNDYIPSLPPLKIDDPAAPQHIRFEVFYPFGMNSTSSFEVCSMNEDPFCRNSIANSNTSKHVTYFDVNLDNWYKTACSYST